MRTKSTIVREFLSPILGIPRWPGNLPAVRPPSLVECTSRVDVRAWAVLFTWCSATRSRFVSAVVVGIGIFAPLLGHHWETPAHRRQSAKSPGFMGTRDAPGQRISYLQICINDPLSQSWRALDPIAAPSRSPVPLGIGPDRKRLRIPKRFRSRRGEQSWKVQTACRDENAGNRPLGRWYTTLGFGVTGQAVGVDRAAQVRGVLRIPRAGVFTDFSLPGVAVVPLGFVTCLRASGSAILAGAIHATGGLFLFFMRWIGWYAASDVLFPHWMLWVTPVDLRRSPEMQRDELNARRRWFALHCTLRCFPRLDGWFPWQIRGRVSVCIVFGWWVEDCNLMALPRLLAFSGREFRSSWLGPSLAPAASFWKTLPVLLPCAPGRVLVDRWPANDGNSGREF